MGSEATHISATASDGVRAALAQVPAVSSALVDVNALAQTRRLPVANGLRSLFDERTGEAGAGLIRGTSVGISGAQGSVSLALALVSEAMRAGSWVAVVDAPWLGLAALEQYGVDLDRLVMVNQGGPSTRSSAQWGSVMAALVDGFEVVIHTSRSVGERDARRVRAHAREKETVLMQVGSVRAGGVSDLQLDVVRSRWSGMGDGHGHLVSRVVDVEISGRRLAGRERRASLWLPDEHGRVRAFDPAVDHVEGESVTWAGSDIERLLVHDGTNDGANDEVASGRPTPPLLRSV